MLDPNKEYTFLIDKVTLRPACVLLQAVYGFDSAPCHVFKDWIVSPVPTFVKVKATGQQIEEFAKMTESK